MRILYFIEDSPKVEISLSSRCPDFPDSGSQLRNSEAYSKEQAFLLVNHASKTSKHLIAFLFYFWTIIILRQIIQCVNFALMIINDYILINLR